MEQIIKAKDLTHDKLAECLIKTIQASGVTISKPDFTTMVVILSEDLKRDYKFLDFAEIEKAFHNGVRKRYGDFFGINVSTLCSWLDTYLASDDRKDYLKWKQQYIPAARQLEQKTELTEQEKEKICRDGMNKAYEGFVKKIKHVTINNPDFKTIGSFIPTVVDYGGVKKCRLVKEGRMQPTETLVAFFKRCYEKGVEKIY